MNPGGKTERSLKRHLDLVLLCICVAVFVLAWAKFLLPLLWLYLADYGARLVVIALIVWAVGTASLRVGPRRPLAALGCAVLVVAATLFWDQLLIRSGLSFSPLLDWRYPAIFDPTLRWGDAVFGIVLVAISEELVFRLLPARIGNAKHWPTWGLYLVSMFLFAAIHLPQGFTKFLLAAGFGLMAMWLYRRFGSIWLPIGAHYTVDLVLFSEIGCWMNVRDCGG